jgi:hypothetical protein
MLVKQLRGSIASAVLVSLVACGGGGDSAAPVATTSTTPASASNTTVTGTVGFDKSVTLKYAATSTINVSATNTKIFFEDTGGRIWIAVNFDPTTGKYTTVEYQDTNGAGLMLICSVSAANPVHECAANSIVFNATSRTLKLNNAPFASPAGNVSTSLSW